MPKRFQERVLEFTDGMVDHLRLVGDLLDVDALRHRLHEGVRRSIHLPAEGQDVCALGHDDTEAKSRLAALADQGVGRIFEATGDGRDVAETEHAAARLDRGFGYRLGPVEGSRDTHGDPLGAGLDGAGGNNRVLPLQRLEQGLLAECPGWPAWRG